MLVCSEVQAHGFPKQMFQASSLIKINNLIEWYSSRVSSSWVPLKGRRERGEGRKKEEGTTRTKKSLGNYTLTDDSPAPHVFFTLSSRAFHTPFGPVVVLT